MRSKGVEEDNRRRRQIGSGDAVNQKVENRQSSKVDRGEAFVGKMGKARSRRKRTKIGRKAQRNGRRVAFQMDRRNSSSPKVQIKLKLGLELDGGYSHGSNSWLLRAKWIVKECARSCMLYIICRYVIRCGVGSVDWGFVRL